MSKGFKFSLLVISLVAFVVYSANLYQQRDEIDDSASYAGVVPIMDSMGSIQGVVYTFDTAPPGWSGNPDFDWRRQFNVPPEVTRAVDESTAQLASHHLRQRLLISVVQKSEGIKTTVSSKGHGPGDPGHIILTNEVVWDKVTIGPLALNDKS